jgi:hypothetical protein
MPSSGSRNRSHYRKIAYQNIGIVIGRRVFSKIDSHCVKGVLLQECADSILDLTPASVARTKNDDCLRLARRDKMIGRECSASQWDCYGWSLRLVGKHRSYPAHPCQSNDPHPVIHERPRKLTVISIGFKKKFVEIISPACSRLRNMNGQQDAGFANPARASILEPDYSVID